MPMDHSQALRVKLERQGFRLLVSLPDDAADIKRRPEFHSREGRVVLRQKQVYGRPTIYVRLTPKGRKWAARTNRKQLLDAFRTDLRRWTERTRLEIEEDDWVASSKDSSVFNDKSGIYESRSIKRKTNQRAYVRFTAKGKRLAREAIMAQQRHEMHELVLGQVSKLQALLKTLRSERVALEKEQQSTRGWLFRNLTPDVRRDIPFDEYKRGGFRLQSIGYKQLVSLLGLKDPKKTKGKR